MRAATVEDIPRLLEMGRKFHGASGVPCGFDSDATTGLLQRMVGANEATIIIADSGAIGGMLSPSYCDPAWIMAVELFWWSRGGEGLRLLREFERWAEDMGAQEVRMTTLSDIPGPEKIMNRRGYVAAEVSHRKVL